MGVVIQVSAWSTLQRLGGLELLWGVGGLQDALKRAQGCPPGGKTETDQCRGSLGGASNSERPVYFELPAMVCWKVTYNLYTGLYNRSLQNDGYGSQRYSSWKKSKRTRLSEFGRTKR